MGLWLLRTLSLKFKGKLVRIVVILLGVCVVTNYFYFRRGTLNETDRSKHLSATLNNNDEKPFEGGLETRLIALQRTREDGKKRPNSVGKNWKHSSIKISRRSDLVTSEFKTSTVSKTRFHDYSNQENKLIRPSVYSKEDDIRVNEKKLENKDDEKISQDNLENLRREANFIPDADATDLSSYICPQKFIPPLENNGIQYGKCKPHTPSVESCLFAERLYFLDKNSSRCKINSETKEICSVTLDTTQQEQGIVRVECQRDLCAEKWYSTSLAVWTLDRRSGEISRVQSYSSILEMEKELPQIIIETAKKGVYFVVLKCSRRNDGESVTQLIAIDPRLTIKRNKKSLPKDAINVNILLLDSVSRAHFYRSLPKTINLFKNWSASELAPAKVFDFELFQAIHGHTAENTHALFTGKALPPHGEDEFPPVEMGVVFGRFVEAGYQTLWQEDLCWKGGWGLMTDLGVMEWEELEPKLQENFIDSTGITHSSCEVLNAYKLETPFNGPEGNQICYNGKFQHEYLLNYTLDTIEAIRSVRTARPLLSYMSLSVGHDNTGRRVQTLDQSLADYVNRLGKDDNTLTIILADHGNTYTEYTVSTLEGRFEMYHPSLFIIVPRNVAKRLGKEAMGALRTNQRRLVNMYDLHYTLMALAGSLDKGRVLPQGVFTRVSADRTCNGMKLLTPNLCVCEGWDTPTTNDTLKISLVEFAVGELNHLIDKKFMESSTRNKNKVPLLKSCRRLIPIQFENVRERIDKNERLRTTMDIHVKPLAQNTGKKETFHVEIESQETPDYNSMDLKLVHFDRMSVFEKYKECSDNGVSPLLCICSNTPEPHVVDNNKRKIDISVITSQLDSFQSHATVEFVDKTKCLLLIRRQHSKQSFSREVANLCLDLDFSVLVDVEEVDNMKFSGSLPAEIKIPAGSMRLVFTARKDLDYWPSSFGLKIIARKIRNRSRDYSRD